MSSDPFASTDSSAEETATDRSTAHVGLVCAHALELRTFLNRLDRRRRYADGGAKFTGGFFEESIRVAVVEAGAGFAAHRRATETLIAEHRPAWVISTGFSSSLAEDVHAGDLSLATSIRDTHGQRLEVTCPIPESRHATLRPHLVTDSHPRTVADKRQLAIDHDAGAVDTASLAVAQTCAETNTRFLSIRAVIDDVSEDMPPAAIEVLLEPQGEGRRNPVSSWISGFRQSPDVKPWISRAATASGRLDRFLTGVIRQLGEPDV